MIRINLLREKKVKRGGGKGQSALLAGVAALAGGAIAVFLLVHGPLADQVDKQSAANKKVKQTNDKAAAETKDFDLVNQQYQALQEQEEAIKRLTDARAVPAWLLHELSSILTKGRQPTMSPEMAERVKTDPNRQWNLAWDPKRVWIDSITEKGGLFSISGGAQSDTDVTQLALRLQASVYFDGVVPEGGQTKEDKKTGVQYYNFTVTGRVVY
jgi:type IV pilus assembly protein PilN